MLKNKVAGWRQTTRVAALSMAVVAGTAATSTGCLSRPIEKLEPRTTTTIIEKLTQSSVDKIDLLLVIDNSRSMADKQAILNLAVPDLVEKLVNPLCLDAEGAPIDSALQPTDPQADCEAATGVAGSKREFEPIVNIHIGVLSSSLGSHGSDNCTAATPEKASENDKAHLITRQSTAVGAPTVDTWDGKGFLAWDPTGQQVPPGESNIDTLVQNTAFMVSGTGEIGCGYEAPLEAWYRFLVDPDPYESVTIENNNAVLNGTDGVVLEQRANFLRPDSLLAVIMLSDENDCSIRDGGQFYFAAQTYQPGGGNQQYHLPKPRAACATDPNSACCRSCGQAPGDGCDTSADECGGSLPAADDDINLRCWDQKRRFGIDFLYPIQRYVDGVTRQDIADRNGNVTQNPLFKDLNPSDDISAVRDSSLVFVAGIVGVPWQDIARKDANGNPDLLNGLNAAGDPAGGFQSGEELLLNNTWDVILGDPSCYTSDPAGCRPTDARMIEDWQFRQGLPGPGTGDPIHGHEWTIAQDDLQYACIFPLLQPRDCTANDICDCKNPANDNPLCESTPGANDFGTMQYGAKAYPGIRELSLLAGVGLQGIVGSICPEQLTVDNGSFGYRPAINTIVERLKQALGGQCLPRSLTPNAEGQVACLILEARVVNDGQCDAICSGPGRNTIPQDHPAVKAAKQDPLASAAGWNCFCEISQLTGAELVACQEQAQEPPGIDGWCYVDAAGQPPIGNPEIVASCPDTEKRIIRFVGDGQGATGATLFITCTGE